jgi:D-aminopeptidase
VLPHQCSRLAQRCALGVARTGGVGEHWSDLMLAFSTARQGIPPSEVGAGAEPVTVPVTMLADSHIDPLFDARWSRRRPRSSTRCWPRRR